MSKKDAYIAKAQATIDEQVAKLDELKAKAKGQIADQKLEAYGHIDKLEAKLAAAKNRLAEIADSAEDAWEGLTSRFEELTDDLRTTVKNFFNKMD